MGTREARRGQRRRRCNALPACVLAAVGLALAASSGVASSSSEVVSLYHPGVLTYYGYVEAPVPVRSAPSTRASVVERLGTSTADGTSMLVEPIAETTIHDRTWFEIHMPVLPNWRTGWVPQGALSRLVPIRTWLIVNVEGLRATLLESGRTLFSAPIGIGKSSTPTPRGSFYVIDRLEHLGYGGEYGPLAFGTSARSPVLTDWPGGGVVGIHGTNEPQHVPGRPSHGCIRMRNANILRLGRLMPVGTPVTID